MGVRQLRSSPPIYVLDTVSFAMTEKGTRNLHTLANGATSDRRLLNRLTLILILIRVLSDINCLICKLSRKPAPFLTTDGEGRNLPSRETGNVWEEGSGRQLPCLRFPHPLYIGPKESRQVFKTSFERWVLRSLVDLRP